MPAPYHVEHPTNKSIISENSPEKVADLLKQSKIWAAGRYKIYKPPPPGKVADKQEYYWGFAVKHDDGTVTLRKLNQRLKQASSAWGSSAGLFSWFSS